MISCPSNTMASAPVVPSTTAGKAPEISRSWPTYDAGKIVPDSDGPSPRIQRTQTGSSVRFTEPAPLIKHISEGNYPTFASQNTTGSFDPHWVHQNILTLDGGGVRGYSSLLILQDLMDRIEKIEKSHSEPADSSFHSPNICTRIPRSATSVLNGAEPGEQAKRRLTIPGMKKVKPPDPLNVKPDESFYPW